ncbi:MAG: hypothetical protein ACOH2R_05715 [Pseudomonas sp.]
MRQALFGIATPMQEDVPPAQTPIPDIVIEAPAKPAQKKKVAKAFTPKLRVTLRVGNEFEGEMQDMIHDADTLSTLLAEQEAVKAARKKFRYVEVVSVNSM